MGRFRGSAGNMTGCKVYDKNVLRAKAFEVSNPNTPAQQTQRSFFKDLSQLIATFNQDELRTLFPQKPKAMSRRNALAKQIAEYYNISDGVKTVDVGAISTLGNAPTMDFGITDFTILNDQITITLDASVSANTNLNDYYFIAVIKDSESGQIAMPVTNAKVSVGTITVDVPASWGNSPTVSVIPLILDTKAAITGFGTVGVLKRPEKE
ncbi:MAG: hypothetical protein IKW46_11155 [Bacteroidaceae bacterium]|nr:hypothetical protein [Bacteroidaceae bacterium]